MKKILKNVFLLCVIVGVTSGIFMQVAEAASSKLTTPEISLSNVASTGKIKIKWKSVKNAVSYKLYSSTDGKTWKCLITTKNTSVTNTSAVAGKKYYYKVKAIASKSSLNSNYSKVKYRTCVLARPVVSLSRKTSTGKPVISWEKVPKAVSYKVYSSTDGKTWKRLITTKNTSVTNTSASLGKKYYYKVKAIASNTAANSAYSSVKSILCQKLTKYQEEVVELGTKIATTWKTKYTQGETGAKNSSGVYQFDCVGFVNYVITNVLSKEIPGFDVTSSLKKFYALDVLYNKGYPGECKVVKVSLKNMQPGDVIFFSHNSTNDHCGIYIGDNQFVHSTKSNGGVAINTISGFYERDLSVVKRYLPEKITAANTKETVAATCSFYSKRGNTNSKIGTLKKGSKVTVLFVGSDPESYNQAYIKTAEGKKGFIYTKNLK